MFFFSKNKTDFLTFNFIYISICRGRLWCILFGIYVYISWFWNGNTWISLDWWFKKCWWCLWKKWGKSIFLFKIKHFFTVIVITFFVCKYIFIQRTAKYLLFFFYNMSQLRFCYLYDNFMRFPEKKLLLHRTILSLWSI